MRVQTLHFSWVWTHWQDPESLLEITAPPFPPQPLPPCRDSGKGQAGLGNGVSPSKPRRWRGDTPLLPVPVACCQSSLVRLDTALGPLLAS